MKFTKKSKKIFVALMLAVVMVCAVPAGHLLGLDFSFGSVEASSVLYSGDVNSDVSWSLDSNYELTISGSGAMTDYTVSDAAPWYDYNEEILSIVIADGVTTVADLAFYACKNVETVVIGDSVTVIGEDAFCDNTSLESVSFGTSVKTIEAGAFAWCESLNSLTLPASISSVGENAFYDCDNIEYIFYDGLDFSAIAIHTNGNSGLDESVVVYTFETLQAEFTSSSSTCTTVTLNWAQVADADGYILYQVANETTQIAKISATTYTVEDLSLDTDYTFIVQAYTDTSLLSIQSEAYTVSTATDHNFGDWVVTLEPTETETGTQIRTCADCGEVETQTIPELSHEHSYTAAVTEVTCTVNGYTTYTCDCGDSYVEDEVLAPGHSYVDWETIIPATGTTTGLETATCEVCGDVLTRVLECLVPTQVKSITAETGSTWLQLSWSEDVGATGYQIFLNGTKIDTLYEGETTYKITDLAGATDYDVYIRSFSKATGSTVWGDYSDTYTFTTNPFKAVFSSYSNTYDAVRVNWNAVTGADGYRLYMYVDGSWETVATVGSSTLTYRIDGLDDSTDYLFKVKAYTRDVNGTAQFGVSSNEYTASTKSTTVQLTSYTNTTSAIRINWSEISVADGYRVYLYKNGSWVNMGTVYGSDTTTFKLTGLDDGTIYKFKVKAFIRDDSGTAIWQDASDEYVTMTDLGTAKISSSSTTSSAIRINWSEVDGATGYKVYMLVDGTWKTIDTIYEGDVTTYRIDGLSSGTTYQFKVCAFSKDLSPAVWGTTSSIYKVTTK